MERGFQPSEIKQGDYILGAATSLKGEVLVPDGQWDAWLPASENQSKDGFESFACVSYAVLNAVEILMRQEFGDIQNLSDRFLAYATGTEAKKGNDPTTVCKFLGKKGDVLEKDWAYPTPATDFYKTPPKNLYTLALEFTAEFEYDNQWVPATPEMMKDALTRSPLTVAGYGWAQDNQEMPMYYTPDGAQPNHYFVVYGYEDGKAWHIFDSYENNYKRLRWDYVFTQVKEHTLHKNVVNPSAFALFIQWLRVALGLDAPTFGAARSPKWSEVRNNFIKQHPTCEVCGTKKGCEIHHRRPFHLHPELELDEKNLITLCRPHHYLIGHLMSWSSYNVNVGEDAAHLLEEVKNRP